MPDNSPKIDLILTDIAADSKDNALEKIAHETAQFIQYPNQKFLEQLIEKENIDNSMIGDGVAVQYMQMPDIKAPHTTLAKLRMPLNFKGIYPKPVDIFALLITPDDDKVKYLLMLSRLTRKLRQKNICDHIREIQEPDIIRNIIEEPENWMQRVA